MNIHKALKKTVCLAFIAVFLFSGVMSICAGSELNTAAIDPNAFVYIMNMGISGNTLKYAGLRNGFAVGNGRYILTAAHCVADFENTNETLRQPMVISPYYGDVFEAEIIAIDDVNDIAILKPAWDGHPALELETSEYWEDSKEIIITGYPPMPKERGGNGKNNSLTIKTERVPLVKTNGMGNQTITVGPVDYAGEGWSGSALIQAESGRIVGITCTKSRAKSLAVKIFLELKIPLFFGKSYITGNDIKAIDSLFQKHQLAYGKPEIFFPKRKRKHEFVQILKTLDTFDGRNEKEIIASIQNLYDELPDSYMACFMTGAAFTDPNDSISFEKTVAMVSDSSFVPAAYGNYFLSKNKLKKAAEQFRIVMEQDPNHIFACHGLLSVLVKTDPNEAITLGEELIQRCPDNAGFHFEYSRALRAKNKRAEELPIIQKAIELCGEDDIPVQYQRYLADSLEANKQYEPSEQAYKKLLKRHECDRCWWAYTKLLLEMGPDRVTQAKKARDKTMTFIKDPNVVLEKQRVYETMMEEMLSDPNTPHDPEM